MLEHMHELMRDELKQTARTDTTFSIVAMLLNLLTLGINSGIAFGVRDNFGVAALNVTLMASFVLLMLIVSSIAFNALRRGQRIREKLLQGFIKMYEDNGLSSYYDSSILKDSAARYRQYIVLLLSTSGIAVLIPLLIAILA